MSEFGNIIMRIEMLGGFSIFVNNRRITEQTKKPSKVWKLVIYLVSQRNRSVSQEELLDIFCREENKKNPGSVLRTMVYRARTLLEEAGMPCASKIITAKNGCYTWNNSIECTTDIEDLEELTKKAAEPGIDENEKLVYLLKAAEIYKGDFLHGSVSDMWAIPLVRWYRSLYINAVHEALEILMRQNCISEAEELSVRALGIEPFDEYFIQVYLRTLLKQKKHADAMEVYKKMESMFFDELGVDFSEELHLLYNEIQKSETPEDTPLSDVVSRWLADIDHSNTYYCDSGDFKVLCQVESRSALRTGSTTYIVRISTRHDPHSKEVLKGGGVMKNLEEAIVTCLRASDIFTRYSPNQYMIMLRNLTYEDCKMLVNKILSKVNAKYLSKVIETSILFVTPAGQLVTKDSTQADAGAQSPAQARG